ncbi:hypothetical protein WDW37_13395 [Bdellovibrionota bacterium FG-1]
MRWLRFFLFCSIFWGTAQAASSGIRDAVRFSDAYQDGYTLVIWDDATRNDVSSLLDRIKQTGVKHLSIPYVGCQTDIYSSDVGACEVHYRTGPQIQAQLALSKGFNVSFLPIVLTPDWQWRGFFDPVDVEGWFKTYGVWIRKIARESKALGLKELIVSSETTALYRYGSQWQKLLNQLRADFDGPLVITVNWGDLDHPFWTEADAIGVSAYYPLSRENQPTQPVLDAAWLSVHDQLIAVSEQWKRPLHITEVGYPSVSSAALQPWVPAPAAVTDFGLQARCFEAFRKAWQGERALVRANIWAVSMEEPGSDEYWMGFGPLGKPAEQVLSVFFSARQSLSN